MTLDCNRRDRQFKGLWKGVNSSKRNQLKCMILVFLANVPPIAEKNERLITDQLKWLSDSSCTVLSTQYHRYKVFVRLFHVMWSLNGMERFS